MIWWFNAASMRRKDFRPFSRIRKNGFVDGEQCFFARLAVKPD
jgi:hypothetical protein